MRRAARFVVVAGLSCAAVSVLAQAGNDAAAHKEWMNAAGDAQDDFREAAAQKAAAKAGEAAAKIEQLMARTERYWGGRKAVDGVKLSRESRTLARRTAAAARAGKFDAATAAFAKLSASCNACHGLHLEKR